MCSYLIVLLLCFHSIFAANILYIAPLPSPSHHIWNRAFAYGLVEKGHNVTLIGPDKDDSIKPANYTHIYLKGYYEALYSNFGDVEMNPNDMADYRPFWMMVVIQTFANEMCVTLLQNEYFQKILTYPENFFDLIIFDITSESCAYRLIHKFKYPPTIGVTPFLLPSYIGHHFGNQMSPAFVPWHSLPYGQTMTFTERVWNYIFTYSEVILKNIVHYTTEPDIVKEKFGHDLGPSMEELERHISLILVNSDPVTDLVQPVAPNVIPVGGLHTKKSKQLPQDLQAILDGAKNGAIIFSLGSNVRSDLLDKDIQKALIEAFSQISETVIWKFESDIENLPKNVIVRKWFPQSDLLGHPNVKLFIGHGGALSTQEAIFHGVPMVCVPFFMDQHFNTRNILDKKVGLSMDFRSLTPNYVLKTVREVLDNPVYSENMKKMSNRFKDRLETPLERAVFWTEYVMRHGGAEFLNSPARDLPFYKALGIDVFAFLLLISTLVTLILTKLVKRIFRRSESKKKVKKN